MLTLENYAGFFPTINLKLSFQPAVQFIDCILKRLLMALFEAIKRLMFNNSKKSKSTVYTKTRPISGAATSLIQTVKF